MSAMRIRHTKRRDRTLLLGAAGESMGCDRWLKANAVRICIHSLFRQGLMLLEHIPN